MCLTSPGKALCALTRPCSIYIVDVDTDVQSVIIALINKSSLVSRCLFNPTGTHVMTGGHGNIVVWTEFMRPPLSRDSGGLTRGSPAVPYLPLNRSLELPGQHCPVRRSRAAGAAHNWLFLPEALFKILVPTFPRTLTLNAPAKCWTLFCVWFGDVWFCLVFPQIRPNY